ncbi:MAG: Gfo/Idh/MocA family oxidoreductase [Planctomycetota bacterium]|jgi:predicted dehydrogenase
MSSTPSKLHRRDVLRGATVTATAAAAGLVAAPALALGGRRQEGVIRVGVVGLRGRGGNHIQGFKRLEGVEVVALCDVDAGVLERRAAELEPGVSKADRKVAAFEDVRDMLARDDVDVVSLATPNHLHALHTIWACEAGKDVYVEKPVSHNIWEGKRMVEVAARTGRIVQSGMQSRSHRAVQESIAWLDAGGIGAPRYAQGLCYKPRKSIGLVDGPQDPPSGVNHDLWSGPREAGPVMRRQYHYDWHWQWPFGNGDFGNQGVHQVDLCRRMLGVSALPRRVVAVGGRFGYMDNGTTPNTMFAFYDLEPAPMIFEVRGLPKDLASQEGDLWGRNMPREFGLTIGSILHAEDGRLAISSNYGRAVAYDRDGKEIRRWEGGGDHFANFIAAVRARDPELLNADVNEGHLSAAYCHLANDSYQLGGEDSMGAIERTLGGDPEAADAARRFAAHLEANGVDLDRERPTFGRVLAVDPEEQRYVGDVEADALMRGAYRDGFQVPRKG